MREINKMNKKGFTLIEIMVAMAVIGMVTVSMVVPAFLNHVETAKKNICIENRKVVEHAEDRYLFDFGKHSTSLQDLVDEGYIKKDAGCPSGGIYAWFPSAETDSAYQANLGCSVHWSSVEEEASSETVFMETASDFIDLLREYFEENGKYPKGKWQKVSEALGLDPDEWATGVEGVVYRPKGDQLVVKSDKGYILYVDDISGNEQDPKKIVYSLEEDVWYYDKIKEGKEVDIDTLRIEEK